MKTKAAAKKTARRAAAQRDFTVRDMNRQPQAVLNAARAAGGVHVRARTGERFLVKLDPVNPQTAGSAVNEHLMRLEALRDRMKADGQGFTSDGWETFSKMIAGE